MSEDIINTDKQQGKKRRINIYKQFNGSWVPEWLMKQSGISNGAKLAYARLARFAGKDGECFPELKTLSNELGVSERSVSRYVNELVDVGLIEKVRRGLGKSNKYYFLFHEWMDIYVNPEQTDVSDQEQTDVSDPSYIKESHPKREGRPPFLKDLIEEFVKDCEAGKEDQYTDAEYLALLAYHVLKSNTDISKSSDYTKAKLENWITHTQELLKSEYNKETIASCINFAVSDPFHSGNFQSPAYIKRNFAKINADRKNNLKKESEESGTQETYNPPKPYTEWYKIAENEKGHILFYRDQGYMGNSLLLYDGETKKRLGGDLTRKTLKEIQDNPKEIKAAFEYVYGVIEKQQEPKPVAAS